MHPDDGGARLPRERVCCPCRPRVHRGVRIERVDDLARGEDAACLVRVRAQRREARRRVIDPLVAPARQVGEVYECAPVLDRANEGLAPVARRVKCAVVVVWMRGGWLQRE